ncbi:MAG: sigma 54-interacting transcriptional regulator [Myxococcales bacterium]|nr:sigma 54-interacting transcriptional regulator [Myxococcales bacterium]
MLLLFGESVLASHALPPSGEVLIGRAPECAVQIDEPSISRRHALLAVGERLELRDLGSSNGTTVRGRSLEPNRPVPVEVGEVVQLGAVMAMVQYAHREARPRQTFTHGYFEGRLSQECARAAAGGPPFAVVRLRVSAKAGREEVQEQLGRALEPDDCAAAFAPGDYELLLLNSPPERAEARAGGLAARLSRLAECRCGLACFGRDGREPESLLAFASAKASGAPQEDGQSPIVADASMEQLYRLVDRVARGQINVLLLGETGVGKEVVAEQIHRRSPRAPKPFVRINCAALTESLLESELFGHEKGAFTGAQSVKAGLLESASGGTVLLDEVGEMPLPTQAKLLRVLEERAVRRVGGTRPVPIDVRFLAATNRDLEAASEKGQFRRDLYFRLNGISVPIPPLRERSGEIEPLARSYVRRFCEQLGRQPLALSAAAVSQLGRYAWPGNVRELRNVIERAVLLCAGEEIGSEHLPQDKLATSLSFEAPAEPLPEGRTEAERQRILDALARSAGNQTQAAKLLGIARRTLINRLEEFGIVRPRKRR